MSQNQKSRRYTRLMADLMAAREEIRLLRLENSGLNTELVSLLARHGLESKFREMQDTICLLQKKFKQEKDRADRAEAEAEQSANNALVRIEQLMDQLK